jgi:hypothetical protein
MGRLWYDKNTFFFLFPEATTDACCVAAVNDAFIIYLLEIIEGASDDADDSYHYPVIRVLVCLLIYATNYQADLKTVGFERAVPCSVD